MDQTFHCPPVDRLILFLPVKHHQQSMRERIVPAALLTAQRSIEIMRTSPPSRGIFLLTAKQYSSLKWKVLCFRGYN